MSSSLSASVVVLISICSAAAVLAMGAAVYKLQSGRRQATGDAEADGMLGAMSNEQAAYMRDVRMRGQIQAYGFAPAFEDDYRPPRSQVGNRTASMGGMTGTSWG